MSLLERLNLDSYQITQERGWAASNPWLGVTANDYIPPRRVASSPVMSVTADSALRNSAVFACLNLRANLVSSTPVDPYRMSGGVQIEVPAPKLLKQPGGDLPQWQAGSTNHAMPEWLYSTQFDLGRYGNVVGIVTEFVSFKGVDYPSSVELVPTGDVRFMGKANKITRIEIAGEKFEGDRLRLIWHERERTLPGCPVGISPVMYAAMSIGGYLEAQKFGLDYFASGGHPSGHLRNIVADHLSQDTIAEAKAQFKAGTQNREIFVSSKQWEFTPAAAPEAAAAFLDEMKYGIADVCRFFDVPGDMIDANQSGASITYANITQRNVQLLVINMGPAYLRRERALSSAVPGPMFVKFNTDALLRMDPQTREELLIARVAGKVLAPSEAREKNDLPPFTPEQIAEFKALGLVSAKSDKPVDSTSGVSA